LPPEPVELQAMRPGKDGLLEFAGRYRWDPDKKTLRDLRAGRKLIAYFDPQQGTLRAPGILEITTQPAGAECWINGKVAGKTPVNRLSPAGPTRVHVRWENGAEQTRQVTVPSGRRVPISFEAIP
jgi:hypothetical protein